VIVYRIYNYKSHLLRFISHNGKLIVSHFSLLKRHILKAVESLEDEEEEHHQLIRSQEQQLLRSQEQQLINSQETHRQVNITREEYVESTIREYHHVESSVDQFLVIIFTQLSKGIFNEFW
jgi:hypothetical protein